MKSFLTTVILFITTLCINAQPAINWKKSFGGTSFDYAQSISQTSDGGYIVGGGSFSTDGDVTGNHGDWDFWVVKLTSAGAIDWKKCLGGSGEDIAYSIQQTYDGGYIVAGSTKSIDGDVTGFHGFSDYWVVKLTSAGAIDWQKCLGGADIDYAYSMQQTFDSGYIVSGRSFSNDGDVTGNHGGSDAWVVKLTSSGSIDWQKCLGGTSIDDATSIHQTSDNGYIIAGYSSSTDGDVTGNHGLNDYWVVKLTNTGVIDWQKSLGGTSIEQAYSARQTSDGGYIVAGESFSTNGDVTGNHGAKDYWVVKLTSTGSIDWQKSLGGSGDEWPYAMLQTSDGGYITAGYSYSNDGDVTGNHGMGDFWVVKLSDTGAIDWQKSLGGTGDDFAFSMLQSTDGGYVIAGVSYSNDGDVTSNQGSGDEWVVKLFPVASYVKSINGENDFNIYPNPADEFLIIKNFQPGNENIKVKFFDVSGREIFSSQIKTSNQKFETSNLENGIYFCQIKTNDKIFNQKFIVRH